MNTVTIHQRLFRRYKWLLFLTIATVSLLLYSPATHAQTNNSNDGKDVQITLSPTKRTMDIKANSSYDGSFTIFNSGSAELEFTVYAAPYQVTNEEYNPSFSTETNRTQIARWVEFQQKEYTLKPGEKTEVPYRITTPSTIPDGGQYAALFAQTKSTKSGSIVSQKRVGMLLYAHGDGKTIDKGRSDNPQLGFWQSQPTFTVLQKVRNEGNTDFDAHVEMSITDVFGHEKYTTTSEKTVLPDTTRAIELTWENGPSFALMNVTTAVTLFGKTTRYTHMVLFATPTALFFVGALLLIIVGGGMYVFKKRHTKASTHHN